MAKIYYREGDDEPQIFTVSALNAYIRESFQLDVTLQNLTVRGEISNLSEKGGHLYFNLKDASAVCRAVMFRPHCIRLRFRPENGMKVLATGSFTLYEPRGDCQILVRQLTPDGVGDLHLAYEQLKRKLEAEGLFDPKRKKPIPRYPRRIGVITSTTGAAVRDILHVLGRRYPLAQVYLYPALVQGEGAVPSLLAGLACFSERVPVDLIIMGRGGGSIEDLWAFNDETLARAAAACSIPLISAVGHETDFTILDFVADLRAPTPSAAAELAVPDAASLLLQLSRMRTGLLGTLQDRLSHERSRLASLKGRRVLQDPESLLPVFYQHLSYAAERVYSRMDSRLDGMRAALSAQSAAIQALSPLAVLARGYSVCTDPQGVPQTAVASLAVGDPVRIRFSDGEADATVTALHPSEKE